MMDEKIKVFETLKTLIGKVMLGYSIDLDKVTMDTTLMCDLGFMSVSMLLMAIAIEEEFGIQIDNLSANTFVTVGDAVNYIERKIHE